MPRTNVAQLGKAYHRPGAPWPCPSAFSTVRHRTCAAIVCGRVRSGLSRSSRHRRSHREPRTTRAMLYRLVTGLRQLTTTHHRPAGDAAVARRRAGWSQKPNPTIKIAPRGSGACVGWAALRGSPRAFGKRRRSFLDAAHRFRTVDLLPTRGAGKVAETGNGIRPAREVAVPRPPNGFDRSTPANGAACRSQRR